MPALHARRLRLLASRQRGFKTLQVHRMYGDTRGPSKSQRLPAHGLGDHQLEGHHPSPETHHQPRRLMSPEAVSSQCKVRVFETEEIHQDVYQTKEKQDMEKRKGIQDTKLECVLRRTRLERTSLESVTVIDSAEWVSLRANPRAAGGRAALGPERGASTGRT